MNCVDFCNVNCGRNAFSQPPNKKFNPQVSKRVSSSRSSNKIELHLYNFKSEFHEKLESV